MNKNLFGFLTLIGAALCVWALFAGLQQVFTAFTNSWTPQATSVIADGLAQVVWLGGIIFVLVMGYGGYTVISRWSKPTRGDHSGAGYQLLDAQPLPPLTAPTNLISAQPTTAANDWYDFAAFDQMDAGQDAEW